MKLTYSYFNQETGQSIVTLTDKYGSYTGYAKCHPEDKKCSSQYTGCTLAQGRAWIKALQSQRRRAKIQLNTLKDLAKDINLHCSNISDRKLIRRFKLKIRDYNILIQNINKEIQDIKKNLQKRIETRDSILKKINKKNG